MRSFSLSAIVTLLAIACGPAPHFPAGRPFEVDPQSASNLSPDDAAVFEAVIRAYAEVGEILGVRLAGPQRSLSDHDVEEISSRIDLKVRPYAGPGGTSIAMAVSNGLDPERWRAMDGTRLNALVVPHSALRDFSNRNARKTSLRAFHPRRLRIHWATEAGTLQGLTILTLPGYSLDRRAAVVEVSRVVASFAGGGELLYLRRISGTWRVVARQQTWIS